MSSQGDLSGARSKSSSKVPEDWDEVRTVKKKTKKSGTQKARGSERVPPIEGQEGREEEEEVIELPQPRISRLLQELPGSSYELLGFRSHQPESRPPIMKEPEGAGPLLTWAANDCAAARVAIGEAAPEGAYSRATFKRLMTLRRVILAEIAKASSPREAMAAAGIAIDREMLIVAAEQVYPAEEAKTLVCSRHPGAYEELAEMISLEAKRSRVRKSRYKRFNQGGFTPKQGKQDKPYLESPFRERGSKLLFKTWLPGEEKYEGTPTATGRWDSWEHFCPLESMEEIWGTPSLSSVAKKWGANKVEDGASKKGSRGDEAEQGDVKDFKRTDSGWGFRKGSRCIGSTDVSYPEKRWNSEVNTRFEEDQQTCRGTTFYINRGKKCSSSGESLKLDSNFGYETWISAGCTRTSGQKIPWSMVQGGDRWSNSSAFWVKFEPLYFYKDNRLVSRFTQKKDRATGSCIPGRLHDWGEYEEAIGSWARANSELMQGARCSTSGRERLWSNPESRISGVCLGYGGKDNWGIQGEKETVQKRSQQLTQTRTNPESLEETYWKTFVPQTGSGSNFETHKKFVTCAECQQEAEIGGSCWRSQDRFAVVEGAVEWNTRAFSVEGTSYSGLNDRCERVSDRLCPRCPAEEIFRSGKRGEAGGEGAYCGECPNRRQDYAYKFEGIRSAQESAYRAQEGVEGSQSNLVYRLCDGSCRDGKTRVAESEGKDLESHKGACGLYSETEYCYSPEENTGNNEFDCRWSVETRATVRRMAEGVSSTVQEMGAFRSRSVWGDTTSNNPHGILRVGKQQKPHMAKDKSDLRSGGVIGEGRYKEEASRNYSIVEENSCGNSTNLEEDKLVEHPGRASTREGKFGKALTWNPNCVGAEEFTSQRVECVLNSYGKAWWATKTRVKYLGILKEFVRWQVKTLGMLERKDETRGMREFIRSLSSINSGETLNVKARGLINIFEDSLSEKYKKELEEELRLLRREANKRHPPMEKAATPVSLSMLRSIMQRAPYSNLSAAERQALDMFCVAFATMSRISEIAGLRARDVDNRGGIIRVRPKTTARTWRLVTKKVCNGAGLEARSIVRTYESKAIGGPEDLLFKSQSGKVWESARIRDLLKSAVQKMGLDIRLTTHAARKGAAVESVMSGAPLPLVQAWGAWESMDSLQDYVGKALRIRISPLEWIGVRNKMKMLGV